MWKCVVHSAIATATLQLQKMLYEINSLHFIFRTTLSNYFNYIITFIFRAENTIRILPPLNTSFEEIDLAFLKLKEISLELCKRND